VHPDARYARRLDQVVEVTEHELGSQRSPVESTEDEPFTAVGYVGEGFGAVASGPAA
jgi:hypothetical protein